MSAILESAAEALRQSASGLLVRTSDALRIARIGSVLGPATGDMCSAMVRRIAEAQRDDGGWASVEETVWCVAALDRLDGRSAAVHRGIAWLEGQRTPDGVWGRTSREEANYVLSGFALTLVPQLATGPADDWFHRVWERDLGQDLQLTYKAALYLASTSRDLAGAALRRRTIEFLSAQQNSDGGFAPWKDHPIGSDAWSTGICLVGLSTCGSECNETVRRAASWLTRTQLDTGYWRYHYLDEGTSFAYWGLSEAEISTGGS